MARKRRMTAKAKAAAMKNLRKAWAKVRRRGTRRRRR